LLQQRGEEGVIVLPGAADVEDEKSPIVHADGHNPTFVARHEQVHAVALISESTPFDVTTSVSSVIIHLEQRLVFLVARVERLIAEQHHAIVQVRVEVAQKVLRIRHVHEVTTE
jgi:hypothetical protein